MGDGRDGCRRDDHGQEYRHRCSVPHDEKTELGCSKLKRAEMCCYLSGSRMKTVTFPMVTWQKGSRSHEPCRKRTCLPLIL